MSSSRAEDDGLFHGTGLGCDAVRPVHELVTLTPAADCTADPAASEIPVGSYAPTPTIWLLHPGDGFVALLQAFTKEGSLNMVPS